MGSCRVWRLVQAVVGRQEKRCFNSFASECCLLTFSCFTIHTNPFWHLSLLVAMPTPHNLTHEQQYEQPTPSSTVFVFLVKSVTIHFKHIKKMINYTLYVLYVLNKTNCSKHKPSITDLRVWRFFHVL